MNIATLCAGFSMWSVVKNISCLCFVVVWCYTPCNKAVYCNVYNHDVFSWSVFVPWEDIFGYGEVTEVSIIVWQIDWLLLDPGGASGHKTTVEGESQEPVKLSFLPSSPLVRVEAGPGTDPQLWLLSLPVTLPSLLATPLINNNPLSTLPSQSLFPWPTTHSRGVSSPASSRPSLWSHSHSHSQCPAPSTWPPHQVLLETFTLSTPSLTGF